jgi:hypothetical protein
MIASNNYKLASQIDQLINEEYFCIDSFNLTFNNDNIDNIKKIVNISPVNGRIYLKVYQSNHDYINLLDIYRLVIELERYTQHHKTDIEFQIIDKEIFDSYQILL